jgi:hypothetical protein
MAKYAQGPGFLSTRRLKKNGKNQQFSRLWSVGSGQRQKRTERGKKTHLATQVRLLTSSERTVMSPRVIHESTVLGTARRLA